MNESDSKKVLWKNVSALMVQRYGKENLTRLAADAGTSPATMTRIKEQGTSVGTHILDQIAKVFELDTWQLLVPNLDAAEPPSLGGDLSGWPMPMVEKKKFLQLSYDDRVFVQGYLHRLIEERSLGNRAAA